nr:uncharacterized protein LOC124811327 [Hydra vulgaris]
MISCAYYEYTASCSNSYKCHLKVFHKHSYNKRLVCSQGGCPMEYNSFQSLSKHIEKSHREVILGPTLEEADTMQRCFHSNNLSLAVHNTEPVCPDNMLKFGIKFDEIDGIFEDSAYFISKLRSYSNIPLITTLKIVDACSDFVSSIVTGISNETQGIFDKHGLQKDEYNSFFENILRLQKPFQGLETKGVVCSTCIAAGQYVSLKQCLEVFLCLPGVLDEIRSNTKPSTNETANPLGSHSTVHKIGALCTILKCLKSLHNSKLENILLSAVIYSSDRIKYSNKDAFSIYIEEMIELETKGFTIKIDGNEFKIYVVLAQIIGDNLGLNGILGYVESFTATYPCRICKMKRKDFDSIFVESVELLRTRECYDYDVSFNNCSLNVFQKKFFNLGDINSRMRNFSYDHSSFPSCPTKYQIKNGSTNIGAIEMLNLVLSFPLLVGDLVPLEDNVWVVFLLCGLTLKFHNLIHYPRIIKMLGSLSHMWVMRCEGKLRGFRRTASSVENFKNVCKTVAIRHQMDQSTRFMAKHGLKNNKFCVAKTEPILLISELIGKYTELYQS